MQVIPADVKIRRNRVQNVDTDRLQRRRVFLIDLVVINAGRTLPNRNAFVMKAAELMSIENELIARGFLPRNVADIRVQSID